MGNSITDFLFNGKPPPNVSTSSTSTTSLPDWYQQYMQAILARGNQIAGAPFQPYTGPRVEGMSDMQQQAAKLGQSNVGAWSPLMSAAGTAGTAAAAPFSAANLEQYKNPYVKDVVDEIGRLGTRNLNENILPGVNDMFTGSGQFGSSRAMEFNDRAIRDSTRDIAGQQSNALMAGENNAMDKYLGFQTQQGNAATQLGGLAQTGQALGGRDVSTLDALGQEQQQLGQTSLNTAYNDFLEQRQQPQNMTSWMNSTLQGLPNPTSTSTATTGPYNGNGMSPSPLAQIAGMYSMYKGMTAKAGGLINRFKNRPRLGGLSLMGA